MTKMASADCSFPRERRVRKRREFLRIQGGGDRVSGPSFLVMIAKQELPGPCRLGLTVTRKYGGSVERNRFRRLVREVFRCSPEMFPAGIDLVVIAKGQASSLGLAEMTAEWHKLAPRLRERCAQVGNRTPRPDPAKVPMQPPGRKRL